MLPPPKKIQVTILNDNLYIFEPERLLESIHRAIKKRVLTYNQVRLRDVVKSKDAIESRLIGVSPKLARLRREILLVANLDVPVLFMVKRV